MHEVTFDGLHEFEDLRFRANLPVKYINLAQGTKFWIDVRLVILVCCHQVQYILTCRIICIVFEVKTYPCLGKLRILILVPGNVVLGLWFARSLLSHTP